jgi:WD40 repeat protein
VTANMVRDSERNRLSLWAAFVLISSSRGSAQLSVCLAPLAPLKSQKISSLCRLYPGQKKIAMNSSQRARDDASDALKASRRGPRSHAAAAAPSSSSSLSAAGGGARAVEEQEDAFLTSVDAPVTFSSHQSAIITVGTMEGHLIGWSWQKRNVASKKKVKKQGAAMEDDGDSSVNGGGWEMKVEYAFLVAEEAVRALACGTVQAAGAGGRRQLLLAAGVGDCIALFDVQQRHQIGSLSHHSDTVLALAFAGNGALLSADRSGTMCVWDTKTWAPLLAVRAHRSRINALAVHTSGRAALSCGGDGCVRLWDLTKGKPVHTLRPGASAIASTGGPSSTSEPLWVGWAPANDTVTSCGGEGSGGGGGGGFLVLSEAAVTLHSASDATVLKTWAPSEGSDKFVCAASIVTSAAMNSWLLLAGLESGKVMVCDPSPGQGKGKGKSGEGEPPAHAVVVFSKTRIKRILPLCDHAGVTMHVGFTSSDGQVLVWDTPALTNQAGLKGKQAGAREACVCTASEARGSRISSAVAVSGTDW